MNIPGEAALSGNIAQIQRIIPDEKVLIGKKPPGVCIIPGETGFAGNNALLARYT